MAVAPYLMQNSIVVIVVGAGLAGLVAATEIADAGKRVLILDHPQIAGRNRNGFAKPGADR